MKVCRICNIEKPLSDFSKNKGCGKDGHVRQCKKCMRDKERARLPTEEATRRAYACSIKRKYGISIEDYEDLAAQQGYQCAICSTTSEKLVVDHDHKTGAVRGLLCKKCNTGLGIFGDTIEGLTKAANYLKRTV